MGSQALPVDFALVQMHPAAEKPLLGPRKIGGAITNADNATKADMLREIVSACLLDLSHVTPLYAKLRERQRLGIQASADDAFAHVKMLRGLDSDFCIDFLIVCHADLTVELLVMCLKKDSESIAQLVSFVTQLPLCLRWSDDLRFREIAFRFLKKRSEECGKRLSKFAAAGGISAFGQVNWAHGCYTLEFNEGGRLRSVKHITGDEVAIDDTVHLYRSGLVLTENWLDFSAFVTTSPMPPIKLCSFFVKDGIGPWK